MLKAGATEVCITPPVGVELSGYFPPRAQFEEGGYAATLAAAVHDRPPFQPDVAERVVEAAARLLEKP